MPPNTVYVGRPSRFGNPYKIGMLVRATMSEYYVHNAKDAVDWYRPWIRNFAWILPMKKLKGKNLACWCPLDQPCHADVLLKIANEERG